VVERRDVVGYLANVLHGHAGSLVTLVEEEIGERRLKWTPNFGPPAKEMSGRVCSV
jgi:hypothetical protein